HEPRAAHLSGVARPMLGTPTGPGEAWEGEGSAVRAVNAGARLRLMGEPDAAWSETGEDPGGRVGGIVELIPAVSHVACDDHEAVIRLDQHRLMPGRVPRSWHDPASR